MWLDTSQHLDYSSGKKYWYITKLRLFLSRSTISSKFYDYLLVQILFRGPEIYQESSNVFIYEFIIKRTWWKMFDCLVCFCRFWLWPDFICTFPFCWPDTFPMEATSRRFSVFATNFLLTIYWLNGRMQSIWKLIGEEFVFQKNLEWHEFQFRCLH